MRVKEEKSNFAAFNRENSKHKIQRYMKDKLTKLLLVMLCLTVGQSVVTAPVVLTISNAGQNDVQMT